MEHFLIAVLALVSSMLNSVLLLAVVQRLDCHCPWCVRQRLEAAPSGAASSRPTSSGKWSPDSPQHRERYH
jgi:hypothetical protein